MLSVHAYGWYDEVMQLHGPGSWITILTRHAYFNAMFMLVECMIQLPQKNSIPEIVCILLEQKPLPIINFYEVQLVQ